MSSAKFLRRPELHCCCVRCRVGMCPASVVMPVLISPHVDGDGVQAEVVLDEVLTGMQLELLTEVLVWHRVAMLVEFHMVVDVDPSTPVRLPDCAYLR